MLNILLTIILLVLWAWDPLAFLFLLYFKVGTVWVLKFGNFCSSKINVKKGIEKIVEGNCCWTKLRGGGGGEKKIVWRELRQYHLYDHHNQRVTIHHSTSKATGPCQFIIDVLLYSHCVWEFAKCVRKLITTMPRLPWPCDKWI